MKYIVLTAGVVALFLLVVCDEAPKKDIPVLGPMAQREQNDTIEALRSIQQRLSRRFSHRLPISKKNVAGGEALGMLPWNCGELTGGAGYYIELREIGKANCIGLAAAIKQASRVLVNDKTDGRCSDNAIIRWEFNQ